MIINGRGLIKALENWAKKVTSGYKDVDVRDLSTSFRDGMAFCAIIHHYRSDLIDFDSLSKGNIFENNSLAFSVAEKQLGVPALLDAEDMVKYTQPDRLSIITYLSQLRNCFENQNKVNSKKPELKRIQQNTSGPPAKISVIEPALIPIKRHEVCQMCKHRVFILERLIVDGKLYHTTCFRCHKCDSLLNPGTYIESDTPGLYECSVCLKDEMPESPKMVVKAPEQLKEPERVKPDIHVPKPQVLPQKDFTSKEAVSFAKSNLLPQEKTNLSPTSPVPNFLRSVSTKSPEIVRKIANGSESSVSVKDKISVFERNQTSEISPTTPVSKLRNSFLSSTPNELPANQFITFSGPKSVHLENESASSVNISPEKTVTSFKISTSDEGSTKKLEKVDAGISSNCDNITNSECFLKESHVGKTIPLSQTEDTASGSKYAYSARTVSESPRVSRDIFKSSLQPLKLSIASIRKDPSSSQEAPSEPEKTFDIPQIKSNYSITLPRSGFSRNLSLQENTTSIKSSHSESNIIRNAILQKESKLTRRSSLESASEGDSNKQLPGETIIKSNSISFNRTISAQDMHTSTSNNIIRSPLRTYTPIYKSMLSNSSLDSHTISVKSDTDSSKHDVENEAISINNRGNSKPKIESNEFITSKILPITPVSKSSLPIESEKLNDDKIKEATNDLKISPPPVVQYKDIQESIEEYPDDLNPFGDEEIDERNDEVEYPDDLNPFGDEDEEIDTSKLDTSKVDDYDESKNPFASDEEEDETATTPRLPSLSFKPSLFENKSPSFQDSSICSNLSSPSSSLKGTLKKRPAPKPPAISDIFKDSGDSGLDSSFNSMKSSPSSIKRNFQSSSPKVRKNKPAPPPPPAMTDSAASVKMAKESDNLKLKSSTQNSDENQAPKQAFKKKKRPAPPVPIPMRQGMKKIPLKEIIQEMKEIEDKQREYERQGREIELLIRDKDKDEEASVEEEEYIMQLFELVNQKNALFRRQAELMYIKRSQRLEEQQFQIEKSIRMLMEKPDSEKADEDREEEERLTMELIDIVDQRNSIIDSIEMDRRRELEEDHSVQEQLEMKNGDLPIPAESKEKSGKKKKDKKKKEKKKQEEQESGKGTLRKKKFFSKKS